MENSTRPEENSSNPFYFYPNENPALVLTPCLLTGNNYYTWSRSMRMALISKNKLKFVDGSISVPDESDPNFAVWERCKTMDLYG